MCRRPFSVRFTRSALPPYRHRVVSAGNLVYTEPKGLVEKCSVYLHTDSMRTCQCKVNTTPQEDHVKDFHRPFLQEHMRDLCVVRLCFFGHSFFTFSADRRRIKCVYLASSAVTVCAYVLRDIVHAYMLTWFALLKQVFPTLYTIQYYAPRVVSRASALRLRARASHI